MRRYSHLVFFFTCAASFVAAWIWFGWQYGFSNSPDSWFRGILGKSIVEGHPYYINVKQGWAYDYGPRYHAATHEPFLPILYALYFAFFGYDISIANYVSCASAALLLVPMVVLSRRLSGSCLPGLTAYLLTLFSTSNALLWEVTAGLSIPTSVLLLFGFLCLLDAAVREPGKPRVWWGAALFAFLFLIRAPEQFVLLMAGAAALILAGISLERAEFRRVRNTWLIGLLLVSPWLVRKLVLFGSPFFTHVTPLVWTDRAYDYFSYHEHAPYPSASVYFQNHGLGDFIIRVVLDGPGRFYASYAEILGALPPGYLVLSLTFGFLPLVLARDRATRFTVAVSWFLTGGYFVILSASPLLENRYLSPVFALVTFNAMVGIGLVMAKVVPHRTVRFLAEAALFAEIVWICQTDFWTAFPKDYLRYARGGHQKQAVGDPSYAMLRERFSPDDVILGPFGDVQRLNFMTGLTLVEIPDNLGKLRNPAKFLRHYDIRYSLVDLSLILPPSMIEKMEVVGNYPVWSFNIRPDPGVRRESAVPEQPVAADSREDVQDVRLFVDAFHGSATEACFNSQVASADSIVISVSELSFSAGALMRSDVYVLRGSGRSFSAEELEVLKRFKEAGGRFLVATHSWVWIAYAKGVLSAHPGNQLAALFDAALGNTTVESPLRLSERFFEKESLPESVIKFGDVFSSAISHECAPLLLDPKDAPAALLCASGDSKLVLWGHDNLPNQHFACSPSGEKIIRRVLSLLGKK